MQGSLVLCFLSVLFYFEIIIDPHRVLNNKDPMYLKNPPANAGDVRDAGSIPGWGRSRGEGHGYPLQYACLENPMDRGAWRATVHSVTKSRTRLK